MSQKIEYPRPDGQSAPGLYFEPEGGKKAPGIVLIQEWWGINQHMESVGEWLAEEDFRVIIPDLFRGKVTTDSKQASEWMNKLNFVEAVQQDIRGAAQFLKKDSFRVGVLGFCMGGALAIASAVHVPEVAASVCYYGIPPKELADATHIKIPIQFHFAKKDDWCSPSTVEFFENSLKGAEVKHEMYRYDAQHAFFNDTRPEVYHPESAQKSWDRTLQFLKKNLGK